MMGQQLGMKMMDVIGQNPMGLNWSQLVVGPVVDVAVNDLSIFKGVKKWVTVVFCGKLAEAVVAGYVGIDAPEIGPGSPLVHLFKVDPQGAALQVVGKKVGGSGIGKIVGVKTLSARHIPNISF